MEEFCTEETWYSQIPARSHLQLHNTLPSCFICVQTNRALGQTLFSSCCCMSSACLPSLMLRWQSKCIWTLEHLDRESCQASVGSTVLLPWLSCCQGNEPFKTRQIILNSSLVQKPFLSSWAWGAMLCLKRFVSSQQTPGLKILAWVPVLWMGLMKLVIFALGLVLPGSLFVIFSEVLVRTSVSALLKGEFQEEAAQSKVYEA